MARRRQPRKTATTTSGPYRADLDSLQQHPVPDWFADAKLGVFIHWGLYSVAGFAPTTPYTDVLRNDYDRAMVVSPYAEAYANAMRVPGTPTHQFHRATYGDMAYEGFREIFERQLPDWDPDAWAEQLQQSGARYVVMVAKHHDGYSVWPTAVPHPHRPDWHSERDLVGELGTAVRSRGLRFGVYYSGGQDWTFQTKIVRTLGDYTYLPYGSAYRDYAEAQVRELIIRYRPDILWNDISWPTDQARLNALFADYYNTVPDGLVNDRWQTGSRAKKIMGLPPMRAAFDAIMKTLISRRPDFVDSIKPPRVPHADFTTPEYTQYETTQVTKWETVRGMGNSFGYNRAETESDYASFEDTLFPSFADAVAKNGNLLINVGPAGGQGNIPDEQSRRLDKFGLWLRANGDAIYGTRPYAVPQARTVGGEEVRLTRSAGSVNLIILGWPRGRSVVIEDLQLPAGPATLLANRGHVEVSVSGSGTRLTFDRDLTGHFSPAVSTSSATRSTKT
jgi:alpha-L-fucosidase